MAMRKLSTIQMFRNNRIWYNEKWLRVNKQWNINAIKDILRLKSKRTKMSALLPGTKGDLSVNWNTLKWRKLNVFGIMIICTLGPFTWQFAHWKEGIRRRMDKTVWSNLHLHFVFFNERTMQTNTSKTIEME